MPRKKSFISNRKKKKKSKKKNYKRNKLSKNHIIKKYKKMKGGDLTDDKYEKIAAIIKENLTNSGNNLLPPLGHAIQFSLYDFMINKSDIQKENIDDSDIFLLIKTDSDPKYEYIQISNPNNSYTYNEAVKDLVTINKKKIKSILERNTN